MKNSSDTNPTDTMAENSIKIARLGKCEVCDFQDAKYTCPKCEVKTCSLSCLQIHKKELNCSGIRVKTKFIALNKMTAMDFLRDYTFLEECTRYAEARKHDQVKKYTRYNKSLPSHLFTLRNAANERGTTLRFLLDNFSRRFLNTTYYDKQSKVINWHVEWIFKNAGNLKYSDQRCSENKTLSSLLDKYLNPKCLEAVPQKKMLEFFQSKGIGNLKLLLKAEGVKRSTQRFYLLDCSKTLRDNLAGKIIVEYPCIHICYDNVMCEYDVIDSDEDVEEEAIQYQKSLNASIEEQPAEEIEENPRKIADNMRVMAKREERRKKRKQFDNDPGNLLFSDERLWDLLSSSESDGNETDEEKDEKT